MHKYSPPLLIHPYISPISDQQAEVTQQVKYSIHTCLVVGSLLKTVLDGTAS